MNRFLCFDFGATSGRAILAELKDNKFHLTEIHRFSNDPVSVNGTLYWDVFRLLHEIKTGLLKGKEAGGFSSVGIDTWGVDFALLNAKGDMRALPVHYRDKRTQTATDAVHKIVSREKLYARSGIQYIPLNTVYQLYALTQSDASIVSESEKLVFMPDLFSYFLTGNAVCERSIASTSALYNPKTKDWDWDTIAELGFNKQLFLPIANSGTVVGNLSREICEELQLDPVPVIAVCGHDTASAIAAITEPNAPAYISCGTWALLGAELDSPRFDNPNFTNEIGYNGSIRYLKNIMGLWIINELKRNLEVKGQRFTYQELMDSARTAKNPGFIDVNSPEFMFPHDMDKKISDYLISHGGRRPTSAGELARCVYESLALCFRDEIRNLEKTLNKTFPALHIIGGGTNATLLMELTAKAIGKPVIAGATESTVFGNAAVQAISQHTIPSLKEAKQIIANSCALKIFN